MLVVEDDAVMRSFVENLLRRMGIQVIETCSDGASALKRLSIFKPDVVLADTHMERMGGLALVREMRRHPRAAVRDTLRDKLNMALNSSGIQATAACTTSLL